MFISIFEYNNIFSGPNNEVQKQGYSSQQSAVLYNALISAMQSTFSRGTLWFSYKFISTCIMENQKTL